MISRTKDSQRCRKHPGAAEGISGRGALLAPDAAQPQLGRRSPHLGHVQPDQTTDAVAATQTASPLPGAAGTRGAVNQLPKSVVREIRTPRSVGTGGGRPPPVTRWAAGNSRPYRDHSFFAELLCFEGALDDETRRD